MSKYLVNLSYYLYYNLETNDLICRFPFVWQDLMHVKRIPIWGGMIEMERSYDFHELVGTANTLNQLLAVENGEEWLGI